jgi:chaperone modulatory protein CbpM
MGKQIIISQVTIDPEPLLTFEELCTACDVTPDFIYELVDYGVIDTQGYDLEELHFNYKHLHRIRSLVRLQHDLEVNLPGAILVLDLMDEVERLRIQVDLFKKHLHL